MFKKLLAAATLAAMTAPAAFAADLEAGTPPAAFYTAPL